MASKDIQVAVRGREKCFNSPSIFFKILLERIQFSSVTMTVHIIFQFSWDTKVHRYSGFFLYLFLINWWLVYNIGLTSVIHQYELTCNVPMSPPSWISFPPATLPTPLGYYRAPVWFPWVIQQIPIGCLFTYVCVYASMSSFISPSPCFPPSLSMSVLYVCISIASLWIDSSVPSF